MLPLQTFIPVLFNFAEGSSRWNWATGRSKWIVWGERNVISAAKQSRHLFRGGDLRTHGSAAANPEDKPISEIIMENHVGRVRRQARDRLYYWTPPYSHNRDHTMACRPILCPAVKMKPYSVLCRPSVSLLKPKNKDRVEANIFIALCSRCRWLRAEWDLWKERAEPEKTQSMTLWLTQGRWNGLNLLFRHTEDCRVKPIP